MELKNIKKKWLKFATENRNNNEHQRKKIVFVCFGFVVATQNDVKNE